MRQLGLRFVEHLAERLGSVATARTVYGEPVQHEAATVIPVAEVRLGFGGGAGQARRRSRLRGGAGTGAGGGAKVRPVGFIRIDDSGARFERIRIDVGRAVAWAAALAASLGTLWWIARARRHAVTPPR